MTPEMLVGAWVVAANKVISKFNTDEAVFEPFEAIILAGRTGELFPATRSMGTVDGQKFESHRKLVKLKKRDAKDVLQKDEQLGLADIAWPK
jgi:hypothetical protein